MSRADTLDRRATFIVLAVAAVGAALYLGWGWLEAAGLTTFIVGLLPCASTPIPSLLCHSFLTESSNMQKKLTCATFVLALASVTSLGHAHSIAGDRIFQATMAVDDPGVGDELDFQFGHAKTPSATASH